MKKTLRLLVLSMFIVGYGFSQQSNYRIINFHEKPSVQEFDILAANGVSILSAVSSLKYKCTYSGEMSLGVMLNQNISSVLSLSLNDKLPNYLKQELNLNAATEKLRRIKVILFNSNDKSNFLDYIEMNKEIISLDHNASENEVLVELPENSILNVLALEFVETITLLEDSDVKETVHDRPSATRSNWMNSTATGLNYNGEGVVVAVREGGIMDIDIVDFADRIYDSIQGGGALDGHKNGVANHLCGAGNINPRNIGIAEGAELYDMNLGYTNWGEFYLQYDGRYINRSSGTIIPNAIYTADSRSIDNQMYLKDKLLFMFSAGNANDATATYSFGRYDTLTNNMAKITDDDKMSKNSIVCQAVTRLDGNYSAGSNGPAYDGRLKPELTSDGGLGTSHAAPKITGVCAQLNQVSKEVYGDELDNSLLKAILLNSVDDQGRKGPDFRYGYGKLNARRAYETLMDSSWFEGTVSQDDTISYTIDVPVGTERLNITLVWTDPPANASPTPWKALVNDLDLYLENSSGTTVQPWILDMYPVKDSLTKDAVRGIDTTNVVEQITFKVNTQFEGVNTINIIGSDINPAYPNQKFHVVYEAIQPEIQITYPIGEEKFVPGEDEVIRFDAYGFTSDFVIDWRPFGATDWTYLADVDNDERFFDWTIPTGAFYNFKEFEMRIRNADSTAFSQSLPFVLAPVPDSLVYLGSCVSLNENYFKWNSVNADHYRMYYLDGKYMSIDGDMITSTIGSVQNYERWYAVSAVKNGIESRRSKATEIVTYLDSCHFQDSVSIDDAFIFENEALNAVTVYPNPTAGNLSIQSDNASIVRYELMTISGAVLESRKVNGYSSELDFNDAPNGIYLLRIWLENNTILTKKVIKR